MYFDRKTRNLPELYANQPILVKHEGKWIKSKVVSKDKKRPRSYVVMSGTGCGTLVRNRSHIKPLGNKTMPKWHIETDCVDDDNLHFPTDVDHPKAKTPNPSPSKTPPRKEKCPSSLVSDRYQTRSGRFVKQPNRMDL